MRTVKLSHLVFVNDFYDIIQVDYHPLIQFVVNKVTIRPRGMIQ